MPEAAFLKGQLQMVMMMLTMLMMLIMCIYIYSMYIHTITYIHTYIHTMSNPRLAIFTYSTSNNPAEFCRVSSLPGGHLPMMPDAGQI